MTLTLEKHEQRIFVRKSRILSALGKARGMQEQKPEISPARAIGGGRPTFGLHRLGNL
jgi:hypothetical protein